ncbi:bifunctional DNA-formamidopyrimidine glycosylase/DNA-(apurinic or apyrimidinic site) lyase [Curtobacterium flaccumfaciens]|uniref:Formamidopyrimidine-DNA glycosylase n=1 Tax=Curtobacterium poinsettiae TaxID=159612 RepID=A0A9Q9T2X6_9MICO|nr:bifunctional DNA-formamidopyrimidine glycosylase/DNA-(apurinic or apyrimidinic site) lyase [Curtobacterium flaccumfaciens]UXN25278.1 bifunctional DNA-formamidopyrimidine glycosylase/DNA-(apurinic or apyrimidinic site) lyase [Curtobacterium flaccumfaciens]UYC80119.1 bifunctional DNA-formamidopyrimidine glycosylase/DNA-(apurinic or apyrimidinic site) lyase [Curtobacterium flaccumfaciens pv. poinsettiae]
MPELPEVEVVRAGLEPAVTGARVLHVDVVDDRALTRHDGPAEDFADRLTGRTIAAAVRRGKFLWMPLRPERDGDRPEALVAHLGMSGQILLGRGRPAAKHRRILIDVQPAGTDRSGAAEPPVELEFVDQRTFGSMAIDEMVPTIDGAPAGFGGQVDAIDPDAVWRRWVPGQVSHIARDPLDPAFDDDRFAAMARKRSSGIKRVLLDQGVVSGIGNIYADESLWAAKLHYDRAADRLSRADLRRLLDEVRAILRRALEDGGTSFDAQYVNVNGQSGYFSQRLNVYGQQGKPCPRCGTTIVREAFMNRSSHICPVCQPRPRARTR